MVCNPPLTSGDVQPCLETLWNLVIVSRVAAKHPEIHRKAPIGRRCPAPDVNGARRGNSDSMESPKATAIRMPPDVSSKHSGRRKSTWKQLQSSLIAVKIFHFCKFWGITTPWTHFLVSKGAGGVRCPETSASFIWGKSSPHAVRWIFSPLPSPPQPEC